MTNYVGYSKVPKATGAQWAELNDRLHAGELSTLRLGSDGTAYFRRAKTKSDGHIAATIDPFQPGPTDPADRRVPRQATTADATIAYQAAAALEPDYTGEDEHEDARM